MNRERGNWVLFARFVTQGAFVTREKQHSDPGPPALLRGLCMCLSLRKDSRQSWNLLSSCSPSKPWPSPPAVSPCGRSSRPWPKSTPDMDLSTPFRFLPAKVPQPRTATLGAGWFLVVGAVPCTVGCAAPSLASAHCMPVEPSIPQV